MAVLSGAIRGGRSDRADPWFRPEAATPMGLSRRSRSEGASQDADPRGPLRGAILMGDPRDRSEEADPRSADLTGRCERANLTGPEARVLSLGSRFEVPI